MTYRWETRKINGKHYVCGFHLKKAQPDYALIWPNIPSFDLKTEYGELRARVVKNIDFDHSHVASSTNPRCLFVDDPIPIDPGAVEKKKRAKIEMRVRNEFSFVDIIEAFESPEAQAVMRNRLREIKIEIEAEQ